MVHQRMGRIKGRYPGFSKRFSENLETDKDQKVVVKLTWKRLEKEEEEPNNPLHGCYVIETTHHEKEALDIWHLYMTLTRVEAAFRSLKTDLGTRPIFHQLAHRTQAHLFLSILAYHLLISIEYQLAKNNDYRCWKTIRTMLETHQRSTIILTDEDNGIHHIRQSGQPEPPHQEIYEKLNIKDPLMRNHYHVGKVTS
jgi:transposase